MAETMLSVADEAQVCAQVFGEAGPVVVLIAGASSSMDGWDDELCGELAAAGRRVVRYDHRDTGRSTLYPPGRPGYTGADLVADAVAVIDQLASGRAHLVGLSMGGGMAQSIAQQYPAKVASLTLIDTTPVDPPPGQELPPPAAELRSAFENPLPAPDWNDLDAVTEYLLANERLFAGEGRLDEDRTRKACRRAAERTPNHMASAGNHFAVAGAGGEGVARQPITAATLVVHGTADLLFPPEHAEALVRSVPGAQLLWLEGGGHQAPAPRHWPVLLQALVPHTAT